MSTPTVEMVLLNRAKNGNDLLAIIDSLTAQDKSVTIKNQPTLENIEF